MGKYANASKILKNLGIDPKTVKTNFDMAEELLSQGKKDTDLRAAILYAGAMLTNSAKASRLILTDLLINPKTTQKCKEVQNRKQKAQ